MILINEHLEKQEEFSLLLPASDQLIFGDSESGVLQRIKINEPTVSEKLDAEQIQVIKKENRNINCIEFSKDDQYIVVTTENKQLILFNKTFQIVKNIVLPRASSKVCFSPSNDMIVADRTGDVYLYKITDEKNEPLLLLGHLSVILDMLITHCGKYIITCDRDEKIRVSHYPNSYNIVTFCLGHMEFVTHLRLIKANNILLSASGDGTIRMWNYLDGKQVNIINTGHLVDEKTVSKFRSQMDFEKVDVAVLPITDVQLRERGSTGILAVSLYSMGQILTYSVDLKTLEYSPLESINVGTTFSFCLCNKLYVLSDKFNVYEFISNKTKAVSYKNIEDKLLEFKNLFVNNNSDVTLLYKRKFDNVQEYMERKKLRLETK